MNMKRRLAISRLAIWGALALAAVGAWTWSHPKLADDDGDPALLLDRAWIDSKPEKFTDYVHAMFVSKHSAVGVFQKASAYDFHFEVAEYRREGRTLEFTFPQTGKRAKVSFKVKACNDLPPFDLCLDLSGNPWSGPKRFYAMKEQENERKELGHLASSLRAHAAE